MTGSLHRLAVATLIDSLGTGLFVTVSVLYFTGVAGFSATEVAVGLSLVGVAALVAAIPLGAIGDRLGHRQMWVVYTLVHAGAMAACPFVRSYPAFLAVVTVVALAEVGASPLRGAYLSLLAGPGKRVRARAYNQAVANAGLAVGAAVGALVLWFPTAMGPMLLANAASDVVAALVLASLPALPLQRRVRFCAVLKDRRYLTMSVLNGLLLTYAAIPGVAFPLWLAHRTSAPTWTLGALIALSTVLVVVCQVRAAAGAETVPGAARVLRKAGVALLMSCALVSMTGLLSAVAAVAVLVAATVAMTAGELWHMAGSWGLSFGLAPEDRQGEYLGAFAMGSRIYDAAGPALVTALTLGLGPPGWLLYGVLLLGLAAALAKVAVRPAGTLAVEQEAPGR